MSDYKEMYRSLAEARDTFDYFICGTTGAVIAYTLQTATPQRLGLNSGTLFLASIAFLALSFYIGLKRIEAANLMKALEARKHFDHDQVKKITGALMLPGPKIGSGGEMLSSAHLSEQRLAHDARLEHSEKQEEQIQEKVKSFYRWRNRLLVIGFLLLCASKIVQPYESLPPSIASTNAVSVKP